MSASPPSLTTLSPLAASHHQQPPHRQQATKRALTLMCTLVQLHFLLYTRAFFDITSTSPSLASQRDCAELGLIELPLERLILNNSSASSTGPVTSSSKVPAATPPARPAVTMAGDRSSRASSRQANEKGQMFLKLFSFCVFLSASDTCTVRSAEGERQKESDRRCIQMHRCERALLLLLLLLWLWLC